MEYTRENTDDLVEGTPISVSAPVRARLKWFNAPKGFGFVNPEDKEGVDAFLHITTLQNIGVQAIGEEACLLCEIEYGDKGAHVKQVLEVLDTGTLPVGISYDDPIESDDIGQTQKMKGTVKWYKPDEGFGFVTPDDGLKDVFIHKTCLDRCGAEELKSGQRLFMTFRSVPKGREVVTFKTMDGED